MNFRFLKLIAAKFPFDLQEAFKKGPLGKQTNIGALFEKNGSFYIEMSNTHKNFQNPKNGQKYWAQNGLKWILNIKL